MIPRTLFGSFRKALKLQATDASERYWLHLALVFNSGVLTIQRVAFGDPWENATLRCYGIR